MLNARRFFVLALAVMAILSDARAATVTWTGGGNLDLSDPNNWGGTAPVAGDDLVFPDGNFPRKSATNDYAGNTTFNSITFAGKGYSIGGGFTWIITNGITCTNTPGGNQSQADNSCDVSLVCNTDLTCNVSTAGSTCKLGGTISGTAGVIKTGPGSLFLTQDCAYTGDTQCQAGALFICESNPDTTCRMTGGSVGCGGLGNFDGECGDLICTGGKISCNLFAPHHLTCEDLTLNANCTFEASLRGIDAGINYFQLTCDSCDLGGCQLRGTIGTTIAAGTEFIIIDNVGANPIIGTFAGIPEGGSLAIGLTNFLVSYVAGDGNDVSLTKVNPTTTLELAAVSAIVEAGKAVTFTARVEVGDALDPSASGSIVFNEGATPLGTAPILSGIATFSIDTLLQGIHTITANYAGDANHGAATSNDQIVTITNPCKPATFHITRIVPAVFGGQDIHIEIRDASSGAKLELSDATKMFIVNGAQRTELSFTTGDEDAFHTSAAAGFDNFELEFPGDAEHCPATFSFSTSYGRVDSDGDGYPDEVEQKLGSDPNSKTSTPNVSNQSAPDAELIKNAKVGLSIDFNKGTGKYTLLGTITLPENFNVDGRDMVVSIGATDVKFHFDAKGKAKGEGAKDAATLGKPKKDHTASFKAAFDALPADLIASGLTNQEANKKEVAVEATLTFNDHVYHKTITLIYSEKKGKGKATAKKEPK